MKVLDKTTVKYGDVSESKKYLITLDDSVKDVDVSSADIVVLRVKEFCKWLNVHSTHLYKQKI